MFQLNEWIGGNVKRVYISSDCPEKVWIEQLSRTGEARVRCRIPAEAHLQISNLSKAGFDFTKGYESWDALLDALFALPGNHKRFRTGGRTVLNESEESHTLSQNILSIDERSAEVISAQCYEFSIDSAPFKVSTIKNCSVEIDTREPEVVFSKFCEGKLKIEKTTLSVGDIALRSSATRDHVIIERKTITDFYSAITGSQHRAHSQAERLYEYQQKMAESGVRVLIIWMIEAECGGRRSMYNTLPKSNQMDGMINYLVAILGQHVVHTFNLHHLCYLCMKFVQGFFEQELFYPVRSATGAQIDKKKSERLGAKLSLPDSNAHGVSLPGRANLFHVLTSFPNIDSRIANSLISSGLVLIDIINLTEKELETFEGVGKVKAKKIYSDFQM